MKKAPDQKGSLFPSSLLPPAGQGPAVDYETHLNPQQRAVVEAGEGPVLVIAGAGSGKTQTVTYRVAYLIEKGMDPSRILLVTFTNKAAKEMLRRVEELLPAWSAGRVWGGTFHYIGNRLLRRHALLVGFRPDYTILDREDAKALVGECLSDLKIDRQGGRFPRGDLLQNLLEQAVSTQRRLEDVVFERAPFFSHCLPDLERVADRYRARKRALNVMDFDDLLFFWKALLEEHGEVRERYREQFRHILVDEYQDTNRLQAEILDLLAGGDGNLMAVGDDAQSIYSFRGANFANILTFPERYPGARIFYLETNYRSTPQILELANSSIRHNRRQFPKRLNTVRPAGPRPSFVPLDGVLEQAAFVAEKTAEARARGVPLHQIAVLYRAHYHSMELQMELTRRRIPFEVRSGLRFFEQAHIKDVGAFLKIACNPRDELAWRRVLLLYPGFGKATAAKAWRQIASAPDPIGAMDARQVQQSLPARARESFRNLGRTLARLHDPQAGSDPAGMIEMVVEEGYEAYLRESYPDGDSRLEDLKQLAAFARAYSSSQEFLSELALLSSPEETASAESGEGTLKLSSVHQAKGLEWAVVFILWLAEGRFPSQRSLEDGEGEEEERRLFYVALTRAKDELYLCYPRYAMDRGGRGMVQQPSRFISELSGEEFVREGPLTLE